jgi:hypothetical protein
MISRAVIIVRKYFTFQVENLISKCTEQARKRENTLKVKVFALRILNMHKYPLNTYLTVIQSHQKKLAGNDRKKMRI